MGNYITIDLDGEYQIEGYEDYLYVYTPSTDKNINLIIKEYKNRFPNKKYEYIILYSEDYKKIEKYLNNNPTLNNSNTVVWWKNYLKEDLEEAKKMFQNQELIKYKIGVDNIFVDIKQYEIVVNILDKIVEEVNKHNFTPLEKAMYTYDLIRDRVYKKESNNESLNVSRDLGSVLLQDKIVCAGYSKIFEEVLNRLDIETRIFDFKIKDSNIGHEVNVSYIKDDKYDVEGVYFFDTTNDSKRSENDNTFLNSYKYFSLTKKQLDQSYQEKFEDITKIENKLINFGLCEKEETLNRPIEMKTLLNVLYNVRKIENKKDNLKYPNDDETLLNIIINSKWEEKEIIEERLQFSQMIYNLTKEEFVKQYINENITSNKKEEKTLVKKI